MAYLVVKDGADAGTKCELRTARVTVGRAPENDLCLSDRTVSRRHAVFSRRADGWYVSDVGSHNNTCVDDAPIVTTRLSDGDAIHMGNAVLVFRDTAEPAAARPSSVPSRREVTQTIRVGELGGLGWAAAGSLGEAFRMEQRLAALLAVTKVATSARTERVLLRAAVQAVRNAMEADRVVPILEGPGRQARPYVESAGRLADSTEGLGIDLAVLRMCRTKAVAGIWRGNTPRANVLCAPIRSESQNLGFIYCDRSEPTAEFTGADLAYLLAVAVQVGAGMENIRSYRQISQRAESLSRLLGQSYNMVGESEAMREVYEFIRKVAPTDAGVLICGESGTGKEMVARAMHSNSRRRDGPLEVVNCAAVPEGLLESELFGHVKGAFTGAVSDKPGRFELADQGTLFLDEVAELPRPCQAKLLRVLEDGVIRRVGATREQHVDVRLVAATNRDLRRAVADGRVREDLLYRLDRLRIEVPLLCRRDGDIPLLAQHFLEESARACGRPATAFSPEVLALFQEYEWPGNVRELKNTVERMVILSDGRTLTLDDVPDFLTRAVQEHPHGAVRPISEVEQSHVLRALRAAEGNKSRAAHMLGIDRSTLYAKLKRYGLAGPDAEGAGGRESPAARP